VKSDRSQWNSPQLGAFRSPQHGIVEDGGPISVLGGDRSTWPPSLKEMKIVGKNLDLIMEACSLQTNDFRIVAPNHIEFLAERLRKAQVNFHRRKVPYHVDIAYHHTRTCNLETIQTHGLLSLSEREQQQIYSRFNGSAYGDGIYCSTDPTAFTNQIQRFGDITILLARLRGNVHVHDASKNKRRCGGFHTLSVGQDRFCVLQNSRQCIPLFWFPSRLLLVFVPTPGNRIPCRALQVTDIIRIMDVGLYSFWKKLADFQEKVQDRILDKYFNQQFLVEKNRLVDKFFNGKISANNTRSVSHLLPGEGQRNWLFAVKKLSEILRFKKQAATADGKISSRVWLTKAIECLEPNGSYDSSLDPYTAGLETLRLKFYFDRGIASYQAANYKAAEEDFDCAIRVDPKAENPYLYKARALVYMKCHNDAIRCLQEGHMWVPSSKALKLELPKTFRLAKLANIPLDCHKPSPVSSRKHKDAPPNTP
jgi:hypothetical protein